MPELCSLLTTDVASSVGKRKRGSTPTAHGSSSSNDESVSVISDYISFCEETIITSKEVKCYPNNKPWITHELKDLLNRKRT